MSHNPLSQYFRQPKIYVSLPSQGVYNKPGALDGDLTNMPIYGMTGMDEIIAKTPDALLSGTSTAAVIESCCPTVKDAWDLSVLDTDLIFASIKIATFGEMMNVSHTCRECSTENEYDLDLSKIVEHYSSCKYDNKAVINDLVITTRPLTYRQLTDFNMRNFGLQQKLSQAEQMAPAEQKPFVDQLWKELAETQRELFTSSVESVETAEATVVERGFIAEWISNCDKTTIDAIKQNFDKNRKVWEPPTFPVMCSACDTPVKLSIELDQSNFFV